MDHPKTFKHAWPSSYEVVNFFWALVKYDRLHLELFWTELNGYLKLRMFSLKIKQSNTNLQPTL